MCDVNFSMNSMESSHVVILVVLGVQMSEFSMTGLRMI